MEASGTSSSSSVISSSSSGEGGGTRDGEERRKDGRRIVTKMLDLMCSWACLLPDKHSVTLLNPGYFSEMHRLCRDSMAILAIMAGGNMLSEDAPMRDYLEWSTERILEVPPDLKYAKPVYTPASFAVSVGWAWMLKRMMVSLWQHCYQVDSSTLGILFTMIKELSKAKRYRIEPRTTACAQLWKRKVAMHTSGFVRLTSKSFEKWVAGLSRFTGLLWKIEEYQYANQEIPYARWQSLGQAVRESSPEDFGDTASIVRSTIMWAPSSTRGLSAVDSRSNLFLWEEVPMTPDVGCAHASHVIEEICPMCECCWLPPEMVDELSEETMLAHPPPPCPNPLRILEGVQYAHSPATNDYYWRSSSCWEWHHLLSNIRAVGTDMTMCEEAQHDSREPSCLPNKIHIISKDLLAIHSVGMDGGDNGGDGPFIVSKGGGRPLFHCVHDLGCCRIIGVYEAGEEALVNRELIIRTHLPFYYTKQ